jgi:23S rRNA pseudouridine2605 synthase
VGGRGSSSIEITIHEGRNRQVRRMCQVLDHVVDELQRTRFGPLALDGLAPGAHRRLGNAEVERLRALTL